MSSEKTPPVLGQDKSNQDILGEITGIGEVYVEALHKIGVHSFADLAQYSAQELATALFEQTNKRVKADKTEGWIDQAKRLDQQGLAASTMPDTNEIIIRRGDTMDEITLQRGGRSLTFKKLPDRFAVRLKQGRATNEVRLESALGRPETPVKHMDAVASPKMDVFTVADPAKLEETVDKLREASLADVVSHVYALDDTLSSGVIPTGTLTIQFKPDTNKAQREAILAEFGLEVVEELRFLPHGYTVRLTRLSLENPLKIALKLQSRPEIEVSEPDITFKVALHHTPLDTLYAQQWHLHNRGDQIGLQDGADVKAEAAWEHTRGSRSIVICIIDDGFDLNHPEFNQPDKIVAPRDFGQQDFDPSPVTGDDNHGTACAGVALAEENGQGVVGLAPRCALMPVRFANGTDDNAIVSYFQHAIEHGADVISCSWSATEWNFPLSTKIKEIIHYAATQGRRNQRGCVIFFAAGNDSRPLDGEKDGRLSVQGFALHPDVIAVSASNSQDQHCAYSNYGPEISICAPSGGPAGWGVVTTARRGFGDYGSFNDYSNTFGGTSSATPLAASLAALMLSVNPELSAAAVKQIMMETADKIDLAKGKYINGHSPLYGRGRINAQKAVEGALAARVNGGSTAVEELQITLIISTVEISLGMFTPTSLTRKLIAEIHFQITGADANKACIDRLPFQIDVYATNTFNSMTQLLATTQEHLQPEVLNYTHQLEFDSPSTGLYTTKGKVSLLLSTGEIGTHQSGTPLRIGV